MPQFSNFEKWRDRKTTTQKLSGEVSFDDFLCINQQNEYLDHTYMFLKYLLHVFEGLEFTIILKNYKKWRKQVQRFQKFAYDHKKHYNFNIIMFLESFTVGNKRIKCFTKYVCTKSLKFLFVSLIYILNVSFTTQNNRQATQ